jgi:uncharacterized GH25 family protein
MKRCLFSLLAFALLAIPARAHFIWIVPDGADGTKVKVVFSDDLEPDEGVAVEKIGGTKLLTLDAAGKAAKLDWKKGEHAYLANLPGKGDGLVGGVCKYGVTQRGEGKPFLLAYYPKMVRGEPKETKPWDELPLEIIPLGEGRFKVLFGGKPAAESEVSVVAPTADGKETLKADARGEFKIKSTAPGLYGVRARHIEAKAGEHDGKKYEEVRHYATLVFRLGKAPGAAADAPAAKVAAYAPLPEAVSSFGAVASDGWLYAYGGHRGRAHQYSTETASGALRRLSLKGGPAWEELPGGPGLQGLALVTHGGKLYRVGGMQPRNKPGDPSDNHSVATCSCYDPATKKWSDLPDMPAGRSSHDAVVVGDTIYVVGGWKMRGTGTKPEWHDTALILDLAAKALKWESIKQPFRRRALTAAAHEGKVYVIAGMTDENELELGVDIYDPAKGNWTAGKAVPGVIGNGFTPASAVAGGRLYVSTADGKVWRLTEKGDAWDEVGTMQRPRFVHRMVAAGDNLLLAVGGASRAGNVDLTEAIVPTGSTTKPAAVVTPPAGQQAYCPIMTDVPVGGESRVVEYRGVTVRLCCAACVRKWNADPEAYLDAKRLPQLAKLELPARSLKQVFCPVYRDRVVSEKDPFVMHWGKKVYLFNQNAVRRWQEDPAKYADAAILPQLAAE